jgi:hypothetical protein
MADNYQITGQTQKININPAGTGFQDVWEVTYKVTSGPSKGVQGMVTVPEEEHDAQHVKAAIESKISDLDEIASL